MNRDFLELMMEKTGFPQEAKTELLRCADSLAASGQGGGAGRRGGIFL